MSKKANSKKEQYPVITREEVIEQLDVLLKDKPKSHGPSVGFVLIISGTKGNAIALHGNHSPESLSHAADQLLDEAETIFAGSVNDGVLDILSTLKGATA